MAGTVRIKRHLDSETIHLPEVRDLIGRDVEIVVRAVEEAGPRLRRYPLRGSVLRYDEPFEPVANEDWEALS